MRVGHRWPRSFLCVLLLTWLWRGIGVAEGELVRCNRSAQEALDADQFGMARQGFKASMEEAQKAGNGAAAASCAFYLGLTNHREALATESRERRADLLTQAVDWYRMARGWAPLALAPGTVTNLGRAYAELGQPKEVDALFSEVIGRVREDERAVLIQGYADVLAQEERWEESAKQYRNVLNLVRPNQPANHQAWSALLDLVLHHLPSKLPEEVWRAVEEGQQTLSAQDKALEALSRNLNLPAEARISLLTAIVAGLALQQYEPHEFPTSEIGRRLQELENDPLLGRGVRQILSLHARKDLSFPSSYDWWTALDSPGSPKRSRLIVFRSLIRAFALKLAARESQTAQTYLRLGDLLQPQIPDPLIYADLASWYAAFENAKQLKSELERWEKVLGKRQPGAFPLDPKDLATYHLKVATVLDSLGVDTRPGGPTSIQYHLTEARREGERAMQAELLLAVGAAQQRNGFISDARATYEAIRRLPRGDGDTLQRARDEAGARLADLPSGGGGGFGGGDAGDRTKWGTWYGGYCMGYPERPCTMTYLELRELIPRAQDRWASGAIRKVYMGCDQPHAARMEMSQQLESRHPSHTSFPSNSSFFPLIPTDTCHRVSLDPEPAWVTSGAWSKAGLLLADPLHAQLLGYDFDGVLRQVYPATPFNFGHLPGVAQVLIDPGGTPVVEARGRLIWLDEHQQPIREEELTGRRGPSGILRAVYQLTFSSQDEAFVFGDVERTDGSWLRGIIRVPLRPGGELQSVHRIAPLDPNFDLYRLGNPYLASVGGRAYFLDLREPVSLNILPVGTEPKRRLVVLSSLARSARITQPADLEEPEATTALYRGLEESTLPAGLYGFKGFLYLLTRRPGQEGKTSWTLTKLDPADGKELYSISLPTSAPHLTVIPGEHHWALVEKGPVERWGRQTISIAVFVPTEWIERAGNASPLDRGGTDKDLFTTSN